MKGWKTILFNIIAGLLLVAEQQGINFGLTPEIIGIIVVIGNFVLRFLTTTPIAMAGAKTVSKAKDQINVMAKKKGI
jgi:hypothetical protein